MRQGPISIAGIGLVTSVGLNALASCAAIRAKLTRPTQSRVTGSDGEWITAHQVALDPACRRLDRLARLAARAARECMADTPREQWSGIPLLLCVAEGDRPGRLEGLDDRLFVLLQKLLGARFAAQSAVVARGRVAVAVALAQAHKLIVEGHRQVLIVAVDSLLGAATLGHLDRQQRLLSEFNSNGFIPGEAAGAVRISAASAGAQMLCRGMGFGVEPAHIASGLPLRGDGLAAAIKEALRQAGEKLHHLDYRMADLSGEQYYFKEAALALLRTMRQRRETFDLLHPAECIGEVGAAAGMTVLVCAVVAAQKRYAPGPRVLAHWSNDAGQRAAVVLHWQAQA